MTIKNFFKKLTDALSNYHELDGGTVMTARIVPGVAGANLVTRDGTIVATYSRARDARRGALRRGLTLA